MKPKKNFDSPKGSGAETIITAITKNVNENECEDISKLKSREYSRKYRIKNRKKIQKYFQNYAILHADELQQYRRKYHRKNKGRIHKQKRGYYQQNKRRIRRKNTKNRDYRNAYSKVYYQKNKTFLIKACCCRFKRRYKSDTLFRIKHLLRTRLGDLCADKGFIKSKRTMKLLGCDLKYFKSYIENLFKPGMTWNNHGRWGWHMDHIIPLDTAKTSTDMEKLCHYKNLQPLWWFDNLSKGNK